MLDPLPVLRRIRERIVTQVVAHLQHDILVELRHQPRPGLVVLLVEHLPPAVRHGNQILACVGDVRLDLVAIDRKPFAHPFDEVVDALSGPGRHLHDLGVQIPLDPAHQRFQLARISLIGLVEHQLLRDVVGADLLQHLLHGHDLRFCLRVGRIDHVQ